MRLPSARGVLREAIAPAAARPDLVRGLRAALVTVAPLPIGAATGRPELALASLAAFSTTLADKGGPYRNRATAMGAYAGFGTVAILVGTLAAPSWVATVLLLLVGLAACGYARVLGAEGTAVGIGVGTALVFALSTGSDPSSAPLRAAFFAGGAVWAMAVGLLLWPVRALRPGRVAVAAALSSVGAFASAVASADPADPDWPLRRLALVAAARQRIEDGRATLVVLRRGRPGRTARAEALVVALESADGLFGTVVAAEDALETSPVDERAPLRTALLRVAGGVEDVAGAIVTRRPPSPRTPADGGSPLEQALDAGVAEIVLAARAVDGDPSPLRAVDPLSPPSPWVLAVENLSWDSALVRHALRTAVATAAVALVVRVLGLGHGYWATMTCLVTLQPHGSATFARAVQRAAGTLIGAGLTIALTALATGPAATLALVFATAAVSVALLPVNYGLYTVFLTPTFVLLAEQSTGDTSLPDVRAAYTLLGTAVALLAFGVLFPVVERDRFPARMGDALAAAREMLDVASDPSPSALAAARRRAGLALVNAEASFQRLLTESPPSPEEHESLLALLLYTRRLVSGAVALAYDPTEAAAAAREALRTDEGLRAALLALEGAVTAQRPPPPLPPRPPDPRLERLHRQLAVQHAAAERAFGGAGRPGRSP